MRSTTRPVGAAGASTASSMSETSTVFEGTDSSAVWSTAVTWYVYARPTRALVSVYAGASTEATSTGLLSKGEER